MARRYAPIIDFLKHGVEPPKVAVSGQCSWLDGAAVRETRADAGRRPASTRVVIEPVLPGWNRCRRRLILASRKNPVREGWSLNAEIGAMPRKSDGQK